ncbi:hypothetical protein QEA69_004728 [Enterobacter hormaechei]|uniref:hypothetical protein n=1 Tax=Enterobacter cloacae complex TaxID=354276 RepID=UPI000DBF20E7|nr:MULTISPECIES: hypothetical protein [Enterobacter cloacae complex]AWX03637.1 hypothetical protein DPF84_18575 [Enterobacter hormaechei]EKV3692606.1 hypothetical protein [Enterobacter hormaechei]MCY0804587.1 hypothetical protein [Enterobacter cloacae complex sp. 2022EL-00747]RAM41567.1 hypothetical protein DOZ52_18625 [Enterobacter hormaechei]
MSTLTKEWLHQTIADLEEERDATPGAVNEDAANALAAMKIALASLEAEAVADVIAWSSPNEERTCYIRMRRHDIKPGSLYTAPPAPEFYKMGDATMRHIFTPTGITDVSDMQAVFDQIETVLAGMWQPAPVSVPDEATPENIEILASTFAPRGITYQWDRDECNAAADSWNSCRAAMLQGAEPVTTAYKLPFEQWLSQQTGTIDVECGCVMTEVFFHWLRVAYEAGNSPVIPDGYALVPVEPTTNQWAAGMQAFDSGMDKVTRVYKAMLAAAPQQEVK